MSRDWLLLLLEPTGEEQMFQMGYFWAGLVTQPTVYPAHRDLCATLCRGACPSVYTYWCGLINIDTQEVSGSWTLLGGLGPRRGGPAHSSAAQRRGWVGGGVLSPRVKAPRQSPDSQEGWWAVEWRARVARPHCGSWPRGKSEGRSQSVFL